MNFENNQSVSDLVSVYEMMKEQGQIAFMEESNFLKLAKFYEEEERLNEALEVIEQAIQQYSFSVDLYIKKAQLLIDGHQEDLALETLDMALIYAPSELEIQLLRAEALIALELFADALHLLNELKDQTDSSVELSEIYFIEAHIYEHQEQFEQMFFALKAALLENPKHNEALERLWLCIELSRNYEDSVALHEQILDKDPYSYLAWYNLGHAYAYLGNYCEAIEAFEFAFVIKEDFEFAYRDCAELCFEMKLYHKALKYYQEILEHFDPDSELLLRIGQCYQYLKSTNVARTFFMRALKLDPLNDEVFFHVGQCFASEGKWKSAIKSYEKAIRIEDKQEEYLAALATAYQAIEAPKKAEKHWKMAIRVAPERSEYWVQLAHFLINLNRGEEALSFLEEAEEFAAGSDLMYCRIACLFAIGRRQEAIYWLGEALHEDFDMHKALFELLPQLKQDDDVINLITAYMAG
jgi:tetratricopeptide (TPR) repeat protein